MMASVRLCVVLAAMVVVFHSQQSACAPNRKSRDVDIPQDIHSEFKRASSNENVDSNVAKSRVRRMPPAVAEKAMEIGGELAEKSVEKLFDKIGEAGERAAEYLENGASVDIQPQNGFMSDDMFAPPAWHIEADVDEDDPEEDSAEGYQMYPMGIGSMMMNGCWGSEYAPGDPCYEHRVPSQSTCDSMIDGAAFIGVGFDARGEYSPDSRKMSLIQRNCAGYSTYDGFDVPDTMNVHGIYETKSNMLTFEHRSEYSSYLQTEAGVSGSFLFFSAGVSTAYGRSVMSNKQQFMSLMDIDVVRYEIFKDVITPADLSPVFLREYMNLPSSYMETGAPYKFQDFIQRWGTHYIKSGVFGGRLEIKKVASASFYSSVEQFSMEAKVDFDSFFASFHAKFSQKSGSSQAQQSKYSTMSIKALGGHQEIAALVSDGGSPTSKTDLVNWLDSIADYPKAFKFGLAPITELLYFQEEDLFPTKDTENCYDRDLKTDPDSFRKFYFVEKTIGNVTVTEKAFCDYTSKEQFLQEITQRRKALEQAVSIYLTEGLVSKDEFTVRGKSRYCDIVEKVNTENKKTLDWDYIRDGHPFTVMFNMEADVTGGFHGKKIEKNQIFEMRHFAGKWFVQESGKILNLADGFSNGGSATMSNQKISVEGLVLTYISDANLFMLKDEDFDASVGSFSELYESYKGRYIARAEWPISMRSSNAAQKNFLNAAVSTMPCNLQWSNIQSFDLTESGVCLYFAAVSQDAIFVTFASVPKDMKTWYFVEITPSDASIHKYQYVLTETSNKNARGLGDRTLHQNYFVCIESTTDATLIEYGKYIGDERNKIIYLSYKDIHSPTRPLFYAFGSGSSDVTVFHLKVYKRDPPTHSKQCGKGTVFDSKSQECSLHCDGNCDPDYGCTIAESGIPSSELCNECKNIKVTMGTHFDCQGDCPIDTVEVNGKNVCPCKWHEGECLSECPAGTTLEAETSECMGGCDDPGQVENAQRTGDGGEYTYTCNSGYYIKGTRTINCIHGDWDASKPYCNKSPNGCTRPQAPSSGRLVGCISHGCKMTVSCNAGFYVRGSYSTTCNNGRWSNGLGICIYRNTWHEDEDEDYYEE